MKTLAQAVSKAATEFTVHVNDKPHVVAAGVTVAGLLSQLGLAGRKGVAVAINGRVVGRAHWPTQVLAAEDRVLVIQATQGG